MPSDLEKDDIQNKIKKSLRNLRGVEELDIFGDTSDEEFNRLIDSINCGNPIVFDDTLIDHNDVDSTDWEEKYKDILPEYLKDDINFITANRKKFFNKKHRCFEEKFVHKLMLADADILNNFRLKVTNYTIAYRNMFFKGFMSHEVFLKLYNKIRNDFESTLRRHYVFESKLQDYLSDFIKYDNLINQQLGLDKNPINQITPEVTEPKNGEDIFNDYVYWSNFIKDGDLDNQQFGKRRSKQRRSKKRRSKKRRSKKRRSKKRRSKKRRSKKNT
jgi:hypothetical protein